MNKQLTHLERVSMKKYEEMKNMIVNSKKAFYKLHDGHRLTTEDKKKIINFYLEMAHICAYESFDESPKENSESVWNAIEVNAH